MVVGEIDIRREMSSVKMIAWPYGCCDQELQSGISFCERVRSHVPDAETVWRLIRGENARLRGSAAYKTFMLHKKDMTYRLCPEKTHELTVSMLGASPTITPTVLRTLVELQVLEGGEFEQCVCALARDAHEMITRCSGSNRAPVKAWRGSL